MTILLWGVAIAAFLLSLFNLVRSTRMATKEEVAAAIAKEKEEVQAALAAQDAKIAELQAKIDAGGTVTSADLDDLKAQVEGIFTPPA